MTEPLGTKSSHVLQTAIFVGALSIYLSLLATQKGPIAGPQVDFAVYHTGTALALDGVWPYDLKSVEAGLYDRLEIPSGSEAVPVGFYLPPAAITVLALWGLLPWRVADALWVATLTSALIGCGSLAWTFGRNPSRCGVGWGIVTAAALLNPLVMRAVSLGQTSVFVCGCALTSGILFARNRPILGCTVWAGSVVKPHLALSLLVGLWYVGGWRKAAGAAAMMVVFTIAGCAVLGGSPSILPDYLAFLGSAHKAVGFNRVTWDQTVSWNRLLLAAGGPELDLTVGATLVGIVVSSTVLWLRHIRCRIRPPGAWGLAAAAVFAPFVAQVSGYELCILLLTIPYMLYLSDRRQYADLSYLLAALIVISIPRGLVLGAATRAGIVGSPLEIFMSYRALSLAAMAIYFIVRRPPV